DVMIRMAVRREQLTAPADTAGTLQRWPLTQQQRHEALSQIPLADTSRTMQQVGVRMLLPPGEQLPEPCLPGENAVSHRQAPSAPESAPTMPAEHHQEACWRRSRDSALAPALPDRGRRYAPTRRISYLPARNGPGAHAQPRDSGRFRLEDRRSA